MDRGAEHYTMRIASPRPFGLQRFEAQRPSNNELYGEDRVRPHTIDRGRGELAYHLTCGIIHEP